MRLNCAECHKHPFDQWTKQDFDDFTKFFARVSYGVQPQDRKLRDECAKKLATPKSKTRSSSSPWCATANHIHGMSCSSPLQRERKERPDKNKKKQAQKNAAKQRNRTARLLGGEEVSLPADGDPRAILMEWMRRQDNPYFARALVNRVWANYFGRGIVDPPDDQSLANPPSNPELLNYLVRGFIEHKYDLKWLHREITASRTYQLSWQTNPTNKLDSRNSAMPCRVACRPKWRTTPWRGYGR